MGWTCLDGFIHMPGVSDGPSSPSGQPHSIVLLSSRGLVVSGSGHRKVEAPRLCHGFGTYMISPLPWVKASQEANLDSTVGYRLHFSMGGDTMNCDHGFPTINGYQKVEFWHMIYILTGPSRT